MAKRGTSRRALHPKLPRPRGLPRPKPLRPRGIRRLRVGLTPAQYLESLSPFGGTKLEQLVDGAAAQIGIHFDAAQVTIYVAPAQKLTTIDRVIYSPLTAIYIDGFQHELRPEVQHRDGNIRENLRLMGYRVVSLGWRELIQDPLNEVRKVLYSS